MGKHRMTKDLFIFGNGEIAELADYYFSTDSPYDVRGFIVGDEYFSNDSFNKKIVIKQSEFIKKYPANTNKVFIGLSYLELNRNREAAYNFFVENNYEVASFVSSDANVSPTVEIGPGCFVLEGNNLQYGVKLKENVMLWSGNHIGHGSIISAHSYVASHVVVSGHCIIGERTFIGVNATIMDHCQIGTDCFIAMDASVTKNLSDGEVVLGAKSNFIPAEDKLNSRIKTSYFGKKRS